MVSQEDIDAARKLMDLQNASQGAGVFGQPAPLPPIGPPVAPVDQSHEAPAPALSSNIPIAAPVAAPTDVLPPPAATPPPADKAPVGGSVVQTPSVPISSVDIGGGLDSKKVREDEIVNKYTGAIGNLQTQLDSETDPNKKAALQVQIQSLTSQQNKALQANDAAFKGFNPETGEVDPTKLGKITPTQNADYQLANVRSGEKKVQQGFDLERQGYEAQVKAEAAKNDAAAASYADLAQTMKSNAQDKAVRDAVFQNQIAQKNADINKSIQDFNSSKVNPNAYWEQKSTGGLLGTALMAGLVGGLNAANGIQGNQVLSRIDQIINNDIDAQKTNIENKGKSVQMQSNALASFEKQGYDREQAIAMTQAAGYDAAATQLKGQLAKLGSDSAKAQGQVLLGQLQEKSAQAAEQATAGAIKQSLNARTVVPGVGANSGFITALVGGKLMVKNVKTGQVAEANDEQKAKYYATEKTRAETAKTEAGIGAPPKQNGKITQILAKSSNLPALTADLKNSYSDGGLNTFSTTKTDAKRNEFAASVSAVTGIPAETIIHDIKNPWLNGSSDEIIDHYAKQAELKRSYYEKNPGAVPGADSEDAGEAGNGG